MKRTFTKNQIIAAFSSVLASGLLLTSVSAKEDLRRALNPPELANSLQYGYSQATITAASTRLVHVAGQVGVAENDPNDFESQVDRAFDALIATLDVAGTDAENVVKITLLIADYDAEKLAYLVEKRKAVFGSNPPASTLIPVSELYAPDVLFEIDAVAVARP